MKKTLSFIICLCMTFIAGISAYAKTPTVYYDGVKMEFDVEPYIKNDRVMVPYRDIFETAGSIVMWDDDTKTVISSRTEEESNESTAIVLQIGNYSAFINGVKSTLDVAPEITEDKTFVPLRFVMEGLGAEVTWDEVTYSVNIATK